MTDMWFGTKELMQWVLPPAVNPGITRVGWSTKSQYLNGGAAVRRSTIGHMEYTLTWGKKHSADVRAITDYADGIYGDGPIYWLDPFTMNQNVMPQMWATPSLGAKEGMSMVASGLAPQTILTPANPYHYPSYTAVYKLTTSANPTLYLPIPPGYQAWIAVVGNVLDGDIGRVVILPDVGSNIAIEPTTVVDESPFATTLDGDVTPGFNLRLGGGAGLIHLTAIMVQMLPKGTEPTFTRFISGQGHSGCDFQDSGALAPYNAAIDRTGVVVSLIETESWL